MIVAMVNSQDIFSPLRALGAALACIGLMSVQPCARAADAEPPGWVTEASAVQHSLADGLPVLSLDRSDGLLRLMPGTGTARAAQRTQAKWLLQHPSGWRLGGVVRSEVEVEVTGSTLALAQSLDSSSFPAADTTYAVSASHLGWRGRGLELGLPWQSLGNGAWQWTANAQWLQLTELKSNQVGGHAQFSDATRAFDFDLVADRYGTGITGPFLAGSGAAGSALSLSLGLRGQIHPDWAFSIEANDLVSRLHWSRMARERLRLNTQVSRVRPDGFLDYEPAITGQQSVEVLRRQMGVHWDSELRWAYAPATTALARWVSMAGMDELWLGWGKAWPAQDLQLTWRYETLREAIAVQLAWRGLSLTWATDGQGAASELKQVALGWRMAF